MNDLVVKSRRLADIIKEYDSLAVAFSGGADSTFLLAFASKVFQSENIDARLLAVTAVSQIYPEKDVQAAALFAKENGICHQVIHTQEMASSEFLKNSRLRCYVCKKIIFARMREVAEKFGIGAVAHGVNADDTKDFRPGLKAAREMDISAPLAEAGLTKNEIRMLAREMGLAVWDKPASGCLATRIPYDQSITSSKLRQIAAAEQVLADLGVQSCRVRHYGETAKIEVPDQDMEKIIQPTVRTHIVEKFRKIGFLYISMDLEGFASGRLNRSVLVQHSGK
jgi:uncharacterized protein